MSGFGSRTGGRRGSLGGLPTQAGWGMGGPVRRTGSGPSVSRHLQRTSSGPLSRQVGGPIRFNLEEVDADMGEAVPVIVPPAYNQITAEYISSTVDDSTLSPYKHKCDNLFTEKTLANNPEWIEYVNRLMNLRKCSESDAGLMVSTIEDDKVEPLTHAMVKHWQIPISQFDKSSLHDIKPLIHHPEVKNYIGEYREWLSQPNVGMLTKLKVSNFDPATQRLGPGIDAGGLSKSYLTNLASMIMRKFTEPITSSSIECAILNNNAARRRATANNKSRKVKNNKQSRNVTMRNAGPKPVHGATKRRHGGNENQNNLSMGPRVKTAKANPLNRSYSNSALMMGGENQQPSNMNVVNSVLSARYMHNQKKQNIAAKLFNIGKTVNTMAPIRFVFRAGLSKMHANATSGDIELLAKILFRHIFIDNRFNMTTMTFGLLRLPALYMLILASILAPKTVLKSGKETSLYDILLSDSPSQEEIIFLLNIYNLSIKLDSLTTEECEKLAIGKQRMDALNGYELSDAEKTELLEMYGITDMDSQEAMDTLADATVDDKERFMVLKNMEKRYFDSETNKKLVLELFNKIRELCISTGVNDSNVSGVGLMTLFTPLVEIEAEDLLSRLKISRGKTLRELARDGLSELERDGSNEILKLTCKIMVDLIEPIGNKLARRNVLINATGTMALPSILPLNVGTGNIVDPVIVFHVCGNSIDINVTSAVHTLNSYKGTEAENLAKYKNYISGLFTSKIVSMDRV